MDYRVIVYRLVNTLARQSAGAGDFWEGNDMSDFEKELHAMFDHIWDCEIDHPVFQDTVGELMEAVIQAYEKHKPTLSTNLAEVGTDCISREQAIDALRKLREEDIEDYGCEIPEGFNQDHLDRATFAIKQLPPIQPEPSEECERCMMEHMDNMEKLEVELAQAKMQLLPIQPAEPKRGRWILAKEQRQEDTENGNYMYNCSNCDCGDLHSKAVKVSYCWNCGAKMEVTT